ncbi:MAG: hypothetical protein IKA34_11260 [Bacteroidales bacterium]|nr:hypothetical protein [Bacteroidales bacterium]
MTKKSTTSISTAYVEKIILTQEQKDELTQLGELNWNETEIAAFFGWDKRALHLAMQDPDSEISLCYLKGQLQAKFLTEARLLNDAKGGNLTAAKQFSDLMRDRSFKMSKLDLFGGADSDDVIRKIVDFYQTGEASDMGAKEQILLEALQMIYSFDIQFGRRKTIQMLIAYPFNMTHEKAADLHAQAIELFNGGRRNTKEALKHHTATAYDTLYHAILDSATSTKDYALAASILDKKVKLLELDKPEQVLPQDDRYNKVIRLYSDEPESIGLPYANRDELAAQIDSLENVTEAEKNFLRQDAGIVDMDIVERLQYVTQENN